MAADSENTASPLAAFLGLGGNAFSGGKKADVTLSAADLEVIEAALITQEKILTVQSRAGGAEAKARLNALDILLRRFLPNRPGYTLSQTRHSPITERDAAASKETDLDALALEEADAAFEDEASPDIMHIRDVPVVNVKKLRARLGMNQTEFAKTFGLSLGAVRNWEQNRRLPGRGDRVLLSMISAEPEKVAQIARETF